MIYIAINVFFNAFILAIILMIGADVMHVTPLFAWCLGYFIAGGLTIIGYTRFGTTVVGLFMPGRTMIGREKAKLEPLLSDVIEQTNKTYGTFYKLSDFKIRITDDKVVNAFAMGYDTITVNRGAFEAFTDEQLRAILGHEMGHLFYRDSVRSIALIFSSFGTRVIMTLYGVYAAISAALTKNAKGEHATAVAAASWIPLLMFLPIIVLNVLGSKIFNLLNQWMSRGAEYRADAFAASLGYKDDMIAALEILDGITVQDNSFVAKLMATHPATMLRIGALEDGEVAKQRMRGLRVAIPFVSDNSVRIGVNSEIMRLATVISIIGVIWVVWGSWDHFTNKPTVIKPTSSVVNLNENRQIAKQNIPHKRGNIVHITKVTKINATSIA